ncbi:butyrophilin subfamily 1 member A1-like isoform X2 [Meriones unguiculatus]|uniref:butyrophilin subfamily 1 member A1-like isoform X2 n=1 Tax=Meriones unguiculatus TaxID=10047 RepID=UPI000B4EB2EE|nr:butyrophilin subfamily 1 member A1-like isoform X2 [Meriones unguiculatus]XP_060228350.1 butyrophilin subfamily 1 member A1-like isoform X2 [Meriones unguiculatus]
MYVAVLQKPLLGYLFTLIVLQLPKMNAGHFEVLGPLEPILALVGEDALLACHFSPSVSAEHMELRWFRNTFSPAVMVYREGQELEEEQMIEYRGRVTLVKDNITLGHVALKIHHIRAFDEGVYGCFFRDKQDQGEAFLILNVAAVGSDPHISMKTQENGERELECTSSGWYPEPPVQWRTASGEKLPSTSESRKRDEEGLFTVAASITIRDSSIRNVFCCIQNILLGQKKQVEISVPAPSSSFWVVTLLLLSAFLGLTGIYVAWKKCRTRHRQRNGTVDCIEWRFARPHAVDVTLDQDTAHSHLVVSESLKSVHLEASRQTLPDSPERFDTWPCVLGRENFTSGKYYWEVEVGHRPDWLLGVCKKSVKKDGFILMSPRNGFWVMELSHEHYWALNPRRDLLYLSNVHRVGIFLDCDEGIVSFYNVNDESLIYTFQECSFSGPVCPLFCLWSCEGLPLTICPVDSEAHQVMVDNTVHPQDPLSSHLLQPGASPAHPLLSPSLEAATVTCPLDPQ